MQINQIILGDSIKELNENIKEESVNLIFADPPYNLSGSSLNLKNNKTGGAFYKINEEWDTFTKDEYLSLKDKSGAKEIKYKDK